MAKGKKALLPRQRAFIEAYVVCLNGEAAAAKAKYKYGAASGLLANPAIRSEVDRRIEAQSRMPASEILARLERQAHASIADFLKPGTLEIDPTAVHEHGDLIQRLWITAEGPRIMLHDSQKALELLGKSRALFIERQILNDMEGMDIVNDEAPPHSRPRAARKAAGD